MGEPDGNRPHVLPTRRCEDNIKVDFQIIGWGVHELDLAQDRDG